MVGSEPLAMLALPGKQGKAQAALPESLLEATSTHTITWKLAD